MVVFAVDVASEYIAVDLNRVDGDMLRGARAGTFDL